MIHLDMGDILCKTNSKGLYYKYVINTLMQAISWDIKIIAHNTDDYFLKKSLTWIYFYILIQYQTGNK